MAALFAQIETHYLAPGEPYFQNHDTAIMIPHIDLGKNAETRQAAVRRLIRNGTIQFGGYNPGKIYGRLSCASGKKMKVENRVFFQNEEEAIKAGYRPCARCMHAAYLKWKNALF